MADYSRREFLKLAVVGGVGSLLAACAKSAEKTVNFFNWSAYIGKNTLPDFTKATGVQVNYDVFADEEEMFAKLRSGAMGYDVVVGTDYLIARLKALSLIEPLPEGALKNRGNVSPLFRKPPYDPEEKFTVPYLWGTTGIGYNKTKLAKAPTSWRDLWDPKYSGKIAMLDNSRDCVGTALMLSGFPETTKDPKAYAAVKELLAKQRPLVKQYTSSTYIDGLVSGEFHLAMAWSGDVLQASRENPDIDYVIPKEGSYMWVDNLCLVKGAGNKTEALALIDHLISGEVAADIANTVRYASPNAAAKPHLDKALLADERVYPGKSIMSRLKFHSPLDSETTNLWNQTWSDVKVL
jgi:spermidine/putrescine-binding protein